jgi:hypothetical protein
MLAEYNGYNYIANVQNNQVIIITYDNSKCQEGFKAKRDYFKKSVSINDTLLKELYEIHYYVKYKDSVEDNEIWLVDEEQSAGLKSNIENDKAIINVAHDAKDGSWVQYEKGAAAKIIKLSDCIECIVEKTYTKHNNRIVDRTVEKLSVDLNTMKNYMLMNRKKNL